MNKGGSEVFRILFGGALLSGAMAMSALAENAPGVTDNEIKIGQTMPYTGPAATFSAPGLAEKAYLKMINDQGGINGRKINLISVDDGYLPWRTANDSAGSQSYRRSRSAKPCGGAMPATLTEIARSYNVSHSTFRGWPAPCRRAKTLCSSADQGK